MARKKKVTIDLGDPNPDSVTFGAGHLRERLALFKGLVYHRASNKNGACYHFNVTKEGKATVGGIHGDAMLLLDLEVIERRGSGTIMLDIHALDALLGAYPAPRITLNLEDPKAWAIGALGTPPCWLSSANAGVSSTSRRMM